METKHCRKCAGDLPVASFNKDRSKQDGLRTTCSACDAKQRAANKERKAETNRAWEQRNKGRVKKKNTSEYNAVYYESNKDAIKNRSREWRVANPAVALARTRRYQTSKLQRTPPWADMSAVAEFYAEAKRLEELTGIQFHVDHIVPLRGELVSGLHVPANLQLLPAHENLSKSNSFEVAA
jgi:hypothetical protein